MDEHCPRVGFITILIEAPLVLTDTIELHRATDLDDLLVVNEGLLRVLRRITGRDLAVVGTACDVLHLLVQTSTTSGHPADVPH